MKRSGNVPNEPRSPRRITPWVSVAVLLILSAGAASASTLTAPRHAPTSPPVAAPETSGAPPTSAALPTTTLPGGSGSSTTEPFPATTALPPTEAPGTATTTGTPPATEALPDCKSSNFDLVLRTDKTTYDVGQTVTITVTIRNVGPACSGFPGGAGSVCSGSSGALAPGESDSGCGGFESCFGEGISISDSSGLEVWSSAGAPGYDSGVTSCPALVAETLATGWSGSTEFVWHEDQCPSSAPLTTNTQCTRAQVSAGSYMIAGTWNVTLEGSPDQARPVQIAISSS